jgi:hypothetical protein
MLVITSLKIFPTQPGEGYLWVRLRQNLDNGDADLLSPESGGTIHSFNPAVTYLNLARSPAGAGLQFPGSVTALPSALGPNFLTVPLPATWTLLAAGLLALAAIRRWGPSDVRRD